jgi:hypothetical protein
LEFNGPLLVLAGAAAAPGRDEDDAIEALAPGNGARNSASSIRG